MIEKRGLMQRVPLLILLLALVYSVTNGYKHIRNAMAVLVEMYRRIKKPLKKDLNALKKLARNGEDKEGD